MELPTLNYSNKFNNNCYSLFDVSFGSFKNEDYILKLNTLQILKFFKDELSIKYVGKGYNLIDYAVSTINLYY
jgi:hypothetical protein